MKLLSPENAFILRETVNRIGIGAIIKVCVMVCLVGYWLWPEVQPLTPTTEVKHAMPDPSPPPASASEDDLRERMTANQSRFYWSSFIWMMEHGKPLAPRSFDGKVLFVSYLADAPFVAENKLNCRPYSERIIIADRANTRQGLACNIGQGSWCRQPIGERAECRRTAPDGTLSTIQTDYSLSLQNMKVDWNRNLKRVGF